MSPPCRSLSATGVTRPDLTFKNIIPVVMAGVLGIFGLIIAVVIGTAIQPFSTGNGDYSDYSLYTGIAHLSAGLTVGLTSLSCGICIGISGDAGVRSVALAPKTGSCGWYAQRPSSSAVNHSRHVAQRKTCVVPHMSQ